MRFWDSSAILPLVKAESGSDAARALWTADADLVVWWSTPVECMSSIARAERAGAPAAAIRVLVRRLRALAAQWTEVPPSEGLRADALRLLRAHDLPAGDALQLAAAIAVCEGTVDGFSFVCADRRLASAAEREGFDLIDPLAAE